MRKLFQFLLLAILCMASSPITAVEDTTMQPIVPCGLNRYDKRHGNIAACMMFKNEARYLQEWIEYHKAIGIKHFYLYNNASTDSFWTVLKPYVESGEIELYDLFLESADFDMHIRIQKRAYEHAMHLARGRHEWLAVIDSDEFICMPHCRDLNKFLEPYLHATGLVINWVMYGSSDVVELAPNELQIEKFVHRATDSWGEHFLFKSIVRPSYVTNVDVHSCDYRDGLAAVYPDHSRFSHTPAFTRPPIDEIRINHYWWRDESYFDRVKRPRRYSWNTKFSPAEIDARRKVYNEIYDPSICHMVAETKARMGIN